MTDQQFNAIMSTINALAKNTIPPANWESFLVGSGQQQQAAPTTAEVAAEPGKYYGTRYDLLDAPAPVTQVIELFSPPAEDSEGNKNRKFVSGTLYQWAKADLPGFMAYFHQRYGVPLLIDKLHPDQRRMIGL